MQIRVYVNESKIVTEVRYLDGTPVGNAVVGAPINDADNPYTMTYYAQWTPIYYTVSIVDANNGTVDAYLGGVSGTKFSARYGDVITLRFTPDSGHEFYRWSVYGEGKVEDRTSPTTTMVVTGNCSIHATSLGPQLVRLYVYFNGGLSADEKDSFETPEAMLKGIGGLSDVKMGFEGWSFSENGYYGQYYGLLSKGAYEVGLFGESGKFYRFKTLEITDEVHSTAIIVYTVTNEIEEGGSHAVVSENTGLEDYPEFATAGSDLNIRVSYGYTYNINVSMVVRGQSETSLIHNHSGSMDNNHSENVLSAPLPSALTGGIVLTGTLAVIDNNTVVHIHRMDVGGTEWSLHSSKVITYVTSSPTYSGTYEIPVYDGFAINPSKSEEMSGITSFSIANGTLTYTVDSGKRIELYYERFHAQALLKIDAEVSVLSDMTGWTRGTVVENGATYTTYQKTVYYEETVSLPTLSRAGYSTMPWDFTGGASGTAEASYTVGLSDVDATGGRTIILKANMSKDLHTMTLITQYGTFSNGASRKSIPLETGTSLQGHLETPVLSGQDSLKYTFAGWEGISETMPDHDVSYHAVWIPKTFRLNFSSSDANASISATNSSIFIPSGSSVNYGEYVTISVVFSSGYTLGSYTATPSSLGAPVQGADRQHYSWSFFMTENVNITVGSLELKYRVFFVVNDVLDSTVEGVKYGTITFGDFHRDGYADSPWYTDSACTVPLEPTGTGNEKYSIRITGDLTLYTKPVANTYTVRYDGNGGTGTMADQTFTYGAPQRLSTYAFVREGFLFLGWTDSAGGVFKYAPSDTVSNLTAEQNGIVTLYAFWISAGNVSVKYDGNPHSAVLSVANGSATPLVVHYGTVTLTSSNYATSGSTEPLAYTDVRLVGGQVESYRVYYYATVNVDGHSSILSGSVYVKIMPREVTITSGSSTRAYSEISSLVNHTVTYSGDGFVTGEGVTITYTGEQTAVGSSGNTFDYTFTPVTNGNNYQITKVLGTLVVTPASAQISINSSTDFTYGDGNRVLEATFTKVDESDGRVLKYEITAGAGTVINLENETTIVIVGAGTATIKVYVEASGTYEELSTDVLVNVARKELELTGLQYSDSKVYDGTRTVAVMNIGTLNGVVGGDIITHAVSASYDSKNAGSRTIYLSYTLSGEKAQNYLLSDPVPAAGTISKKPITITSGSATKTYDGKDLVANAYSLSGSFASGEGIASVSYTGKQKDVGSSLNAFTYTLTGVTDPSNYVISKALGTLTVTVRYIDVPVAARDQAYTGSDVPAFSVFTPSSYYTVSGTGKDIGVYYATITLSDTVNTKWVGDTTDPKTVQWRIVTALLEEGLFVVDTSPVVYRGTAYGDLSVETTYDENQDVIDLTTTPRVTSGKYVLGVDYAVSYSNNVNVGSAVITITGMGGYGGTFTYTFEITPCPIMVLPLAPINAVYDGEEKTCGYILTLAYSGDYGRVSVEVVSGLTRAIAAGQYEFTISNISGEAGGNYYINTPDGKIYSTWSILPRTAYVVAGSAYGSNVGELSCSDVYTIGVIDSDKDLLRSCLSLTGTQVGVGSSRNMVSFSVPDPADVNNPTAEEQAKLALLRNYELVLIDGTLAIFDRLTSSVTVAVEEEQGSAGGSGFGAAAFLAENAGSAVSVLPFLLLLAPILLIRRRKV